MKIWGLRHYRVSLLTSETAEQGLIVDQVFRKSKEVDDSGLVGQLVLQAGHVGEAERQRGHLEQGTEKNVAYVTNPQVPRTKRQV